MSYHTYRFKEPDMEADMIHQTGRIFPGAVYDQKVINALHDNMVDSIMFMHRPLPARRVFASYWRVLNVDGFKKTYEHPRLFWWPTTYLSREQIIESRRILMSNERPFVAPDRLSPYRDTAATDNPL